MMSRPSCLAALRALARKVDGVGSVDVRDGVSNRLYKAVLHHFGSLEQARLVAGVDGPPPKNQRWSEQVVIAELRRAHLAGVRLTPKGLADAGLRGLANAAREWFGGLPRARKIARVGEPAPILYERVGWDDDMVISRIRALHRERQPLAASKAPSKLVAAGMYYFGSWRDAIEAAGLDYDRVRLVREPYGRAELLALLRDLHVRSPDTTLSDLHAHGAAEAWAREFGSIEDAARTAGLAEWPVRGLGPLMDADAVVAAIRARHDAGRSLTSSHVFDDDSHLHNSAVRHFGAWHDAIVAAKLHVAAVADAIGARRRWTKTAARDALRARRRAGKSMSPSAIRDDDSGLYQAAKELLGYNADLAIREWGAPKLQTRWTKQAVIEALKAHPEGRPRGAIGAAAIELFGSMGAAREAAGLPLLREVWTDQRVVDDIRALDGAKASSTLVSIAQRRFGSWRAALAAAGIPRKIRTWDVDQIADALRRRLDERRDVDGTAVRREEPSLYSAVTHRFGDFDRAVARYLASGRLPPWHPKKPGRPAKRG